MISIYKLTTIPFCLLILLLRLAPEARESTVEKRRREFQERLIKLELEFEDNKQTYARTPLFLEAKPTAMEKIKLANDICICFFFEIASITTRWPDTRRRWMPSSTVRLETDYHCLCLRIKLGQAENN